MINEEPFIVVPTWKEGHWTKTIFKTREEFRERLDSLFLEPGKYNFDETSFIFNEQARKFRKQGDVYCLAPFKSKDFIDYWDDQKEKNRNGVLFQNGGKEWYLPRDYYMWLNFLPIYDKEKRKYDFPQVRDAQYHMALYEIRAELYWKHCAIFKKRQIASSYFHMAKLINQIWFEEGVVLKMGASLKDYVNIEGSWKYLEEYRSFLNSKTAWYRPMNPGKVMTWQQKIEAERNGRKIDIGLKGMLQAMSFEQSPTKGVGGPCKYFFYEEGGIAPTADKTFEYIRPAMMSGDITTGMFIIAGSVGDLSECEPLKEYTLHPDDHGFMAVESNLLDEKGTWGRTGLFIPEQWSMPPYIDEYGNSKVEEALKALDKKFNEWKKQLSPELYQLRISQHPRNIKEGFDYRTEMIFPSNLVLNQKRKIEEKEYPYEFVDLFEDADGKIKFKNTTKLPITEFPVDKRRVDKSGSIVVWERPIENSSWGTYFASVDPVSEGKTTTSESLCSIYIYKNPTEVTKITDRGEETIVEHDKIVAAWCGRFDDIQQTHERLRLMIEWYNAWTIVENNISLFIQYMISLRKQKYLVPKNQIAFLKDLHSNSNVYQEYGWKNVGSIFKDHMLNYLIEYCKEVIDVETKNDGEIVKKTYGISRIPDIMAMVEMENYRHGVNVDRLVSLAALIAFAKVQQANKGYSRRIDNERTLKLQNSQDLYKFNKSAFRNIGGSTQSKSSSIKTQRRAFRNIR